MTDEKILHIERFMDRIRASNPYGEPIMQFNEDSVNKDEMKDAIDVES